jgi:hypothetical protein
VAVSLDFQVPRTGGLILQTYLTHDVYEKNYGGHDTRLWGRFIMQVSHLALIGLPPPVGSVYQFGMSPQRRKSSDTSPADGCGG